MNRSKVATLFGVCGVLRLGAISLCSAALPPDPNNAALLYYQAFLLCPEPKDATRDPMNTVSYGSEPDEQIREYLQRQKCRQAIQAIVTGGHGIHWALVTPRRT